jgi:hypothetical protein
MDPDLTAGRAVFGNCAVCHGRNGEGGVGPALHSVVETFSDCETQVRWISLGSQRWKEEIGDGYGTNNTPIKGAMPAFDALPEHDRRLVAFYERVTFGGADPETERAACGLNEMPQGS